MKKVLLILAPIIVVVVGARGIWAYHQMVIHSVKEEVIQVAPATTASTTPLAVNETANWKTYTNEKYGFSFEYPSASWAVNVNKPDSIVELYEITTPTAPTYTYPSQDAGNSVPTPLIGGLNIYVIPKHSLSDYLKLRGIDSSMLKTYPTFSVEQFSHKASDLLFATQFYGAGDAVVTRTCELYSCTADIIILNRGFSIELKNTESAQTFSSGILQKILSTFVFNKSNTTVHQVDGTHDLDNASNGAAPDPDAFVINVGSVNTPTITENWKTYTNNKYGFSIQYPNGAKIFDVDMSGGRNISFETSQGVVMVEVVTAAWYNGVLSVPANCNDFDSGVVTSHVTINGVDFLRGDVSRDFSGMNSATSATEYCMVQNGTGYKIIARMPDASRSNASVDNNILLNHSVESFMLPR